MGSCATAFTTAEDASSSVMVKYSTAIIIALHIHICFQSKGMTASGLTTSSTGQANTIGPTANFTTGNGGRAGFKAAEHSGVAVWHAKYGLRARAANIEMLRYPNGLQVTGMWEQGKLALKQ